MKYRGYRSWRSWLTWLAWVSLLLWPLGVSAAEPDAPIHIDKIPNEVLNQMAAQKAQSDRDPHLPLPPEVQALIAKKQRMVDDYLRTRERVGADHASSSIHAASCFNLAATQQGQQTPYWCGPAAVSEALAIKGISLSQSAAASLLRTTTDGTAWSGVYANVPNPTGYPVPDVPTGYPVPDVLNYELGYGWYVPQGLPDQPTQSDVNTFINRMTFDIGYGYPVIGDAWELAGCQYPHLSGHPCTQEIFHWFTIYGYCDNGDLTNYMDSATTVWSGVQPYNSIDTPTLVVILGGRGYVW